MLSNEKVCSRRGNEEDKHLKRETSEDKFSRQNFAMKKIGKFFIVKTTIVIQAAFQK